MQVYGPENFSRYNMFNHHFFDGERSVQFLTKFLTGCSHDQVAMVFDPPFGGMVEALSVSIREISELWKSVTKGSVKHFVFATTVKLRYLELDGTV